MCSSDLILGICEGAKEDKTGWSAFLKHLKERGLKGVRLNLAAARLRHIAGTAWSTKRYLNIELLKDQQMRGAITA